MDGKPAAAALNHANIASIHAIEENDDEMFIVMEYMDQIVETHDYASLPTANILNYRQGERRDA